MVNIAVFLAVSYFNIGDVSKGGSATLFKPVARNAVKRVLV